jgi:4'-phosphopantetheinyl transferase
MTPEALNPETVYITRVALKEPAAYEESEIARDRDLLSTDELKRADSFIGEHHRCDFIHAHAELRIILANYLGTHPREVKFAKETETEGRGSRTKPALISSDENHQSGNAENLRFNLSHTHGQALIAVTLNREVGIDIEWRRPIEDLDSMAQTVMSMRELSQWKALPADQRLAAFYRVWTRKEAYLKAIGLGLFRSLQGVTVPVSAARLGLLAGQPSQVEDEAGEGVWHVTDLETESGYAASVCWEGDGIQSCLLNESPSAQQFSS